MKLRRSPKHRHSKQRPSKKSKPKGHSIDCSVPSHSTNYCLHKVKYIFLFVKLTRQKFLLKIFNYLLYSPKALDSFSEGAESIICVLVLANTGKFRFFGFRFA